MSNEIGFIMKKNVITFLENSYCKYPTKCACADEKNAISYCELWVDSHIIAGNLMNMVDIGMPVPVLMKKSCTTLKIIWGIIKAGGCYVIIDSSLPKERIANILRTLDATWIIGESCDEIKIPEEIDIFSFESLLVSNTNCQEDAVNERINQICDIDPLYIMFTSGSTGLPKGIVANHRSVIDFIDCFTEIFEICEGDIIGNQAPWDFDVSVKDIFSAARVGATLQIIPKKYFSLPTQLVDFLGERKITTLIWAVSALCIISSRGVLEYKKPESIKKIIFSGEVMPVKQYNIWRKSYPDAMFVNVYGPTEITCNCTYFFVEDLYNETEVIPIGSAFPNEKVFLLDDNECPINYVEKERSIIGEICISGTAVTMGYYNNFDATNLNFVQNPLNDRYPEIIYKTGDLGYYNENGQLCYSSRKDFQIKHMGHRIELGEIEKVVNGFSEVNMCCCVYHENEIVMFYEGKFDSKIIISQIRKKLPVYMVPAKIVNLDVMPLNKNGKTDRAKLVEYLE